VHDLHAIVTPENVRFELELAGLGARALAWAVDAFVTSGLLVLVLMVCAVLGVVVGQLAMALYVVLAFVIQWGYGALFEWRFSGQTLGKRAVGIRVLQTSGMRISLLQATVRNLVRIVDLLPALYLTGGVSALLDPLGRRLGDLAAGTIVVRHRRSARPSAVVAQVERYNSFIHDPTVVQQSTRITAPERDAMVGLALRRESLPLPVRHELFAKLARHLQARLGLSRPDYFSEERFVLNLTAVVLGLDAQRSRAEHRE
jgi:uncharacterized RDD family membrane protein YckC